MNKLIAIKQYLKDRIQEPSTITAIASVLAYFLNKYYQFADEQTVNTILTIIMGAVLVTTKEQKDASNNSN
jgi:hypothetical protein